MVVIGGEGLRMEVIIKASVADMEEDGVWFSTKKKEPQRLPGEVSI
jgi:hypothetical protein